MTESRPVLPFTPEEYASRLGAVRAEVRRRELAGLVVVSPHNLYWLTGFRTAAYFTLQACVVPEASEPLMVAIAHEEQNILRTSWVERYRLYGLEKAQAEPARCLADVVREAGLEGKRVGIEAQASYFTGYLYERVRALLPTTRFEDATDVIHGLRVVKSPREIEYIREAARYSSVGIRRAIETVRPGLREHEVAGAIYHAMVSAGSDYFGPIYLSSGERSATFHDTWADRVIQEDDHVYIELSGTCHRYVATFMRTVTVGRVRPEIERLAAGSIAALDAAEEGLRPGMTSDEAARLMKRAYREAAGVDTRAAIVGYSLGVSFPPGWGEWYVFNLSVGDERVLQENMCLHLVPTNTAPGVGNAGLSEPVWLTRDGVRCLASVERKLWRT
jgi:Xaa-Pro aminopeptidase